MMKLRFSLSWLIFCMATLSGCSFSGKDTIEKPGLTDQQAKQLIQQLIVDCALPVLYYTGPDNPSLHLQWRTVGSIIQLQSQQHRALQSCVDQYYATKPFPFRDGLSGKITIRPSSVDPVN